MQTAPMKRTRTAAAVVAKKQTLLSDAVAGRASCQSVHRSSANPPVKNYRRSKSDWHLNLFCDYYGVSDNFSLSNFGKNSTLQASLVQHQVFQDFDAFAESIRDIDSRMLLRNPQQRIWSTSSVDLDEIDVQVGRLGSGNIAQGQLRPGGYMLYLPLTDTVEYSANGSILERNSFAILDPGCEFCISTKVEHDWCVAFIPSRFFAQRGDPPEEPSRSCHVTLPDRLAVAQFRTIVSDVMNAAFTCPDFEASLAAQHARSEVLQIASRVFRPTRTVESKREGRPRVARRKIIQHSMNLLEQRARAHVTVGELAAAANVSERTFRAAFREYFGVSPSRYLQLRQLHQVHRALLAADPDEETVSEILMAHGEWAFGRFASRYRKHFGKLPSQTLLMR